MTEDITINLKGRGSQFPSRFSSIFSDRYAYRWLISPAVVLLAIFSIYPLINLILLSLQKYNLGRSWMPREFIGLDNFIYLLSDSTLHQALLTTARFGLCILVLDLTIGFGISWLLSQKIRGSTTFRTIFMVPMTIVPVVSGLTWRLMLNYSYGSLNWIVAKLGMEPQMWLGNDLAFISLIISSVWLSMPFAIMIFTVAFQQIPETYYEAAALDGAGPIRTFFQITLPNMKWALLLVGVFKLSDAVKTFSLIYALTGGGPGIKTQTLSIYMQKTAFTHYELGYASALSILLLVISFTLVYPLIKRMKID